MRDSSSLASSTADPRRSRQGLPWLRIVALISGVLCLVFCSRQREIMFGWHEHVTRSFSFDFADLHIYKALTYFGEGLFIEIGPDFWGYLGATLILGAAAASIFMRSRGRWRQSHLRCMCCGYDLRASKDRCPECGTRIAADPES